MPGFSRRPLAVFVCCLFVAAQTSHAADDVLRLQLSGARATGESLDESPEIMLLAAADVPLRLRPERRFNVLGKKKQAPVSNARPRDSVPRSCCKGIPVLIPVLMPISKPVLPTARVSFRLLPKLALKAPARAAPTATRRPVWPVWPE